MKMMKQAADLQRRMAEVQQGLATRTVEFSSGGGAVTAVVRGDLELERLRIDPSVVNPAEVALLEDLVCAAVRGAAAEARAMAAREMAAATRGLDLPPGFSLPL